MGFLKKILFLGGGACTLVSLRRIADEAKKAKLDLDLTVITKDEWHYFPAFFPDVALGEAEADDVRAPVRNFAEAYGAKLVLEEVTEVDPANRKVKTKSGKVFEYDYLFLCLGTSYAWDKYPGLKEAAYHNYTLEGALKLREALGKFKGGDIVVLVPEFPHRCPGYPFEVLGRLVQHAKRRGVRANVKLVHVVSFEMAMQHLFDLARTWHAIHQEIGNIEYIMGKELKEVDPAKKIIRFKDGEMKYDLLIVAPPTEPPKPLKDSDFVWKKDKRFLETTFPTFRSRKYDDVFIPTDSAMPSVNLPYAGVPVHYAAVTAADNVLAELKGAYASMLFPENITIVLDFGTTGVLVVFDVKEGSGGVAITKPYIGLTHPMIKLLKYSFYSGWIKSIKTLAR